MSTLERAIEIATRAHAGQVDKAGAPYILHPVRVMLRVQTEHERMAAILHDVVEDTSLTLADLKREGFPPEVVSAVDSLTCRGGEPYEQFIARAGRNSVARRVKCADLEDNMDISRIPNPTEKDWKRLEKYRKALGFLTSELRSSPSHDESKRVDECEHQFEILSRTVLPGYMEKLRAAVRDPWKASDLIVPGQGLKSTLEKIGRSADFSGCYSFWKDGAPDYVGISRGVVGRVRQHLLGKTHFSASLPYLIAKRRRPITGSRSDAMKNRHFLREFGAAQKYLRSSHVAAIEIENPVELHLFEVYAALELRTGHWNSFRTH